MPQPDRPKATPRHNGKLEAARRALPSPSGAPGMWMSRRELAEAANAYVWKHTSGRQRINMTEHDIGRYERGEVHWPNRWRRYGLRGALTAKTDAQLGFYPNRKTATADVAERPRPEPERPTGTAADLAQLAAAPDVPISYSHTAGQDPAGLFSAGLDPASAWVASETIDLTSRSAREDLSLDRREATRAMAGLVVGGALLERLEGWLSPGTAAVRPHRRPGVGYQEVEHIEHTARLFRNWDDQFGGGLRRKAVVGQLSEVADELRDFAHPAALTRRLFGVMAQLAETAATMSWDCGQGTLAQRYYVIALRAAKEAGDRAFGANVLAGMARQLFYLGHVSEGLELVRLAQDGVDGCATPTVRALLHTREAWAYAKLDRLAAFRRATSRAEDCLRSAVAEDEPGWIAYFGEAELAGVTGGRLLEVAHQKREYADEAASLIDRAVQLRRPQSLRSAALDQVGLAEARLIQGEPEEAARVGHEAMNTVEQTHSDRVRVKLVELYGHTQAFASVPTAADLRDRIKAILDTRPGLPA